MKSSNPNSGIYEADTCRTLDLNGGNPACNQGGMCVVSSSDGDIVGTLDASYYKGCGERQGIERTIVCVEGNGQRESHKGDGYRESETMYTLNTVEHHAVCVSQDAYDKYSISDQSATIKQSGGVYGGGTEALVIQ